METYLQKAGGNSDDERDGPSGAPKQKQKTKRSEKEKSEKKKKQQEPQKKYFCKLCKDSLRRFGSFPVLR